MASSFRACRIAARVAKLESLNAPEAVIETARAGLDNPLKSIGRIAKFGDYEFVNAQPKEYRRGQGVEFTLEDGS